VDRLQYFTNLKSSAIWEKLYTNPKHHYRSLKHLEATNIQAAIACGDRRGLNPWRWPQVMNLLGLWALRTKEYPTFKFYLWFYLVYMALSKNVGCLIITYKLHHCNWCNCRNDDQPSNLGLFSDQAIGAQYSDTSTFEQKWPRHI